MVQFNLWSAYAVSLVDSMIHTWMEGCLGSYGTGASSIVAAFGMIRNDIFGIPGLGIKVNNVLRRTTAF